jgi:hypothetical protein
MERKASSLLMENIMYLIILIFFVSMIMGFLWTRSNSAALWEDFYAKELARTLNSGEAGDSLRINVHKGTVIAKRSGIDVQEASNMFIFNAKDKKVCVTLSKGGGRCYPYFNNVAVTNVSIELGVPTNFLTFKIEGTGEVENE